MISPDLVRVRRRGERLELVALKGPVRLEAERISSDIAETLAGATGKSEEEIDQLLAEIPRAPSAEKLLSGLMKVALDHCEFQAPLELDAPDLRQAVFERAAARRQADGDIPFERSAILAEVAETLALEPDLIEQALFSDLRGARLLVRPSTLDASEILARYELAQVQGVLLRAVRIGLDVVCKSPDAYRALFRKLKFRRLLHRIEPREGEGYHVEIDGPLSLFESVTKYGLAMAQLVPALRECQEVRLTAEVRWGAKRQPLTFQTSLGGETSGEPPPVRDEVQSLIDAVNRAANGWKARLGSELFDIPGAGIVVPDLALDDEHGRTVYVEVMGYWSREAVFRRLDWMSAEGQGVAGRPVRLILAVSSQLRVSPDLVPPEAHGAVYVYKGTMSARALLERAQALCEVRS